ncbi:hypothetical protein CBS147317_6831 [Penicillium roqueforti]|nr:hypothetical protein CBS147372_6226 [Penicillium roqueforti]KAI3153287.1 hypothetical protein CBS147317_6831 [Penicillium roqueforti]KAI3275709.1 hypothetical protein CBS147309_3445 [Penicillium roqueforti]
MRQSSLRDPVYPQLLQSPPLTPPLFSYWRTKDRVPAWSSRVPSLLLPPTCATPFSALVPSLHLPLYTPLSLDSIARLRFLGHAIPSAHLGQAQALPWLLSDILVDLLSRKHLCANLFDQCFASQLHPISIPQGLNRTRSKPKNLPG